MCYKHGLDTVMKRFDFNDNKSNCTTDNSLLKSKKRNSKMHSKVAAKPDNSPRSNDR